MLRKRRLCKQQAVERDEKVERKSLKLEIDTGKTELNRKSKDNRARVYRERNVKGTCEKYGTCETGGTDKVESKCESRESEIKINETKKERDHTPYCYSVNEPLLASDNVASVNEQQHSLESGYGSDPDESDHFEVTGLKTSLSKDEPDCALASPESPWHRLSSSTGPTENNDKGNLFFRKAKKFPCSPAYIQHANATDNPELGDKFGAYVRTNTSAEKEGYYRHFFCKVEHGSPAYTMKIEEEDEIVLINERFVPDLNHDEIMALINRVPVDGVTRFKLVLRRLKGDAWEWFETSAILVPELLEEPRARDVKLTLLKNNMYDKTTYHRYNVIGTQLYVDISSHAVSVGVLTGDPRRDNTKTICKHTMVCTDKRYPPRIIYISSLGNADKCCFLTINETTNQAFITTKESFFEYKTLGSQIYFKQNDVYLSCVNKKVCATKEMQMFDEMPTTGHRDVPDIAPESCNNMDIDMLDGAGPTTPPSSGPELGSRTSPRNSLGVVGAIAKPRNSSLNQAGVTRFCNNTEDMLDSVGANSSPCGTPRTPPYCGDKPRRASLRNGTGYSSINNGDIGVTDTMNGAHGKSGARIRGGNGDMVYPPVSNEVVAAFGGNLGRKRSHDEMNKRDSGYGTASPWDTPPRRVTRSLSKQLSVTSLFGDINLD